jgi:hypothetical protein
VQDGQLLLWHQWRRVRRQELPEGTTSSQRLRQIQHEFWVSVFF